MLKPILFNTEMVQAIWARRKTVTRRLANRTNNRGMILKPYEVGDVLWVRETWALRPCIECPYDEDCERDKPDVLETKDAITEGCWLYRADGENPYYDPDRICWSPSIHMPKAAARIFLRVTEVACGALQESILGAAAPMWEIQREGIQIYEECETCIKTGKAACVWTMGADEKHECGLLDQPLWEFAHLWDSTVPKGRRDREGWAADPWVWVVRFECCGKPEGWPG